jgi:phosphoserine phosphatase
VIDLVLQGPGATRAHADALAGRVGGLVDSISSSVFRVRAVPQKEDIAAWCDERKIDHAWMSPGKRFSDLGLVAMDMDSTLITIECIDELGDMAGVKPQVASITAAAMRGELDYPASLRRRVELLKGLKEEVLGKVYEERLRLTPGAEVLVEACQRHAVKLLLVSGGFTFFTDRLKARLGIDYTISNTLEVAEGKLTGGLVGGIVDADAKAGMFLKVMRELGLGKDRTVAIGDGANDLKMMAQAGLSVAFHAKPVVRAQASCALTWSGLDGVLNLFER